MTGDSSCPDSSHGEQNMSGHYCLALVDFCYRLESFHYIESAATADGAASIVSDEKETRQNAKLLMSLCASIPTHIDDLELVSASGSETAYLSDSSLTSRNRSEPFSFVCPSLSLEQCRGAWQALGEGGTNDSRDHHQSAHIVPADLLGRRLTVDDRDALRLSADAMARNVVYSVQKALDWRIESWIAALSKILADGEKELMQQGATKEDLQALLDSQEALLLLALRDVSDKIRVIGASTSFWVQPSTSRDSDFSRTESPHKRQRLPKANHQDYYKSTYPLILDCAMTLDTLLGHSEIALQVPGTIEGTFSNSQASTDEELTCVVLELSTDIMAAMIEKACRTVVRKVTEYTLNPEGKEAEESREVDSNSGIGTNDEMTSPAPTNTEESKMTCAAVRGALVTPRALFSPTGGDAARSISDDVSPKPLLQPIPDNLDDCTGVATALPRRISPPNTGSGGYFNLAPRSPAKQSLFGGPSLVSPAPMDKYQDVAENEHGPGPSLPMLVEVACRERATQLLPLSRR